ncbi:hypothetical protein BJ875DRAFT_478774 [Amylocarpus encephaloides]|uniref:Uncharacterized protein n=1 Tax=Amylocarpus encephaloides TaxID=45428 RepID=A0A9P8BYV0_9HELO|nr:hypothetical protein BJ875DRAFT_478774 [Amylocarpus encephaloides]
MIDEADRKRSLTVVYITLSRAMLSLMTEARTNGPDSLQTSRYAKVVDIIEDISIRKIFMAPSPPPLDLGVIPPLLFTLRWCKDVVIKFRAMELLKSCPIREGLWYRDDIITLVEQQSLVWI